MEAKERFEKMLKERFMIDSAEEITEAVCDFLNSEADRIKEETPYATTTIHEYEKAAYIVSCMLD